MYKQFSHNPASSVIGVNDGICQVEFNRPSLTLGGNIDSPEDILLRFEMDKFLGIQHLIDGDSILDIQGSILPKAKATDIMVFRPALLGFNYLVSGKVKDILSRETQSVEEYQLFKIEKISGVEGPYYLLFVPLIPMDEIIFSKSTLYRTVEYLKKDREHYTFQDYDAYESAEKQLGFLAFNELCIPAYYTSRKLIAIQGVSSIFMQEELIAAFKKEAVSSFLIPRRQVRLLFK